MWPSPKDRDSFESESEEQKLDQTKQGATGQEGFYPDVLETFFRTAEVFLLAWEQPKLWEVVEHVIRGQTSMAIFILKMMRCTGSPVLYSPFFIGVERLVYASICPYHKP